jgi:hypothetical protein
MDAHALNTLADQIQAATLYDAGLCRVAFDLVETKLPALDKAMIRNGALGETDAVLMFCAAQRPMRKPTGPAHFAGPTGATMIPHWEWARAPSWAMC